jgi:Starch-binding associating with outer membrane/Susd and RagB outer membrane lipoprotein
MKNFKYIIFLVLFATFSCETIDLEQTEDPSRLNAEFLDPTYTFNYVQLQLANYVDLSNDFTQRVTRQMAMTGGNTYDNAFTPTFFNENWRIAYKVLNAIKLMEPKAIQKEQFYQLGASKVIRCYILMNLVDMYGDIPYTEALLGNDNLTPKFDKSSQVYKGILNELDSAVAVLQKTTTVKVDDAFVDLYFKDKLNWITLANTLKIKLYCNSRLAGNEIGITDIGLAIKTIVDTGNYIDKPEKDFAFKYGSSRNTPNSRHPLYNDQYELGGGAYISNYMMWTMTTEKGTGNDAVEDPRTAFYFYRQKAITGGEDTFVLPNRSRPAHYNNSDYSSFYNGSLYTPFTVSNWYRSSSLPSGGFWGRDHGDNSGIPPDATFRTVCGLYPIGGKYTSSSVSPTSVQRSGTDGALGAGIMPIMLSSYVHFMLAEVYKTPTSLFDPVKAKIEFIQGITESIDKVTTFLPDYTSFKTADLLAISTSKTNYLSAINILYDGNNPTKQLEMIIKEFNIAAWGNGIETYNSYRRTGYPSNYQPTLEPFSGAFYYTALYPANSVNNNPNSPKPNSRERRVFWDKSNLILH